MNTQREIARLLQTREQSYEAAHNGLDGLAIVGPHSPRTACTEEIAHAFAQLHPLVGGQERAMHLLNEHLNKLS